MNQEKGQTVDDSHARTVRRAGIRRRDGLVME